MFKNVIIFFAFGVIGGAIVAFVIFLFSQKDHLNTQINRNEAGLLPLQQYPEPNDELTSISNDSKKAIYVDRDYDLAVTQAREAVEIAVSSGVSIERVARAKADLASRLQRDHMEEGLEIYAELYNNVNLPDDYRARTLFNVMWIVSSGASQDFMTPEVYAQYIATPETFGDVVGVDNLPQNAREIRMATTIGFEKAIAMAPGDRRTVGLASAYLARTKSIIADPDGNRDTISKQEANEIKTHLNMALLIMYQLMYNAELLEKHDTDIFPFASQVTRVAGDLTRWGQYGYGDFKIVVDKLNSYADQFKAESYTNAIMKSTVSLQTMFIELDLADQDISKVDHEYMKSLVQPFYDLTDQDYSRQKGLANMSYETTFYGHASIKSMAKIDSQFGPYLVEKIGGWTMQDFE